MIFFTFPLSVEVASIGALVPRTIEEMIDLFDCTLTSCMANVNKNIDKISGKQ
jgi:hypothetical protein